MEKRLFQLYLNEIQKKENNAWKHVFCTPLRIWLKFALVIVSLIVTFVCTGLYNVSIPIQIWNRIYSGGIILGTVASLLLCIFLHLDIEKYEIQISDKTIKDYWNYCYDIRNWFKRILPCDSSCENDVSLNIKSVQDRIDKYYKTLKRIQKQCNERIDKWVQVLAIPFILAIVSAIVEKNEDTVNAISTVFSVLIIFIFLACVVWVIWSMIKMFRKRRLEQIKCFSEDLQGAIDCIKYSPK